MKALPLYFFLVKNVLSLVVRGSVFPYDLQVYGFDASLPITRGEGERLRGNNLFHPLAETLIEKIKNDIKSKLTTKDRFWYGVFACGKEGIFISDRPLNNLGARHFIDFMEQVEVSQSCVYYQPYASEADISQLMQEANGNNFRGTFLGKVGRDRKYNFASNDESISQSERF